MWNICEKDWTYKAFKWTSLSWRLCHSCFSCHIQVQYNRRMTYTVFQETACWQPRFCWGDPLSEGREESWSKNFQPGDVCFFRYLIVVNASPSVLRSWDVDEKRGGLKRRGSDFSRACRHGIARDQKQEKAEQKIPFRVGLVGIPPQRLFHFGLEGYFMIFPEMHDSFFIIFLDGWSFLWLLLITLKRSTDESTGSIRLMVFSEFFESIKQWVCVCVCVCSINGYISRIIES